MSFLFCSAGGEEQEQRFNLIKIPLDMTAKPEGNIWSRVTKAEWEKKYQLREEERIPYSNTREWQESLLVENSRPFAPRIPHLRALYFPPVLNTCETNRKRMGAQPPPDKVELEKTIWKWSLWVDQLWIQHFCSIWRNWSKGSHHRLDFIKITLDCSWWKEVGHWSDVSLQTEGK